MSATGTIARLVGASVQRVEDERILTGRGRYVDDVRLPGMLHAAFLRSGVPHGRIAALDVEAARAAPGVVAVFTADDLRERVRPLRLELPLPGFSAPEFAPLAGDKVRFVGDPVALIVATSRALAEDARDLILLDVDPLAPVATMEDALDPSRPPLFDELGSNVVYRQDFEHGDVDAAFAEADRVIAETFRQHRVANVPMETRGLVAAFEPATGELTVHAATQSPHLVRLLLCQFLGQPAHRTRVLAGDVGGAFGLKAGVHREDFAVAAASVALGRPVKWIEDRNEHLAASGHAREETLEVEAAVREDGEILGLRVRMTMDQGAYPVLPFPSAFFGQIVRVMLPGPYRIRGLAFEQTVVATNKASYVAYRGPWAVETWVRETLVDLVARELSLDPVDVRRRNLVTLEEQPVKMVTGPTLERVSARETLERAVEAVGYEALRADQQRARAEGRRLGIGVATFIEAAPGPRDYGQAMGFPLGKERAIVVIEPDGQVTAITAQAPHGQGHETTLAQVAADEVGVPFEQVRVVHGDTRVTPFSMIGTGGSRSATMAGGAMLYAAREARAKVLRIAGAMLEASPDDLDLQGGVVSVRGAPQRALPLAQVAAAAYLAPQLLPPDEEPGIRASFDYDGGEGGWAQATHVCVVEVDDETGKVEILRYLVAEDCGTMINPAVVEGQIRGGVAQGIGLTLLEHAVYDEDGQFLASTFMDYLLPTTMDVPTIEIEHLETAPISPVNFRGVGEGGAICAPPAVTNAVADALGVRVTQLPLTPERVLELAGQ